MYFPGSTNGLSMIESLRRAAASAFPALTVKSRVEIRSWGWSKVGLIITNIAA